MTKTLMKYLPSTNTALSIRETTMSTTQSLFSEVGEAGSKSWWPYANYHNRGNSGELITVKIGHGSLPEKEDT